MRKLLAAVSRLCGTGRDVSRELNSFAKKYAIFKVIVINYPYLESSVSRTLIALMLKLTIFSYYAHLDLSRVTVTRPIPAEVPALSLALTDISYIRIYG